MSIRHIANNTVLRLFETEEKAARVGLSIGVLPMGYLAYCQERDAFLDEAGIVPEEAACDAAGISPQMRGYLRKKSPTLYIHLSLDDRIALRTLIEGALRNDGPTVSPVESVMRVLAELDVVVRTLDLLTFLRNHGFTNQMIRELDERSPYVVFDL